ncbi:MAG: hypothetical protein JNL40_09540 [Cyclobacteriaceae bacterium]|nr:hypothetical protein [Cyclobacteriaceae bacterium]
MVRFFPLGFLILLFSSCLNEPDCIVTSSNKVNIAFLKLTSDSTRAVELDSILVMGTDSVFNMGDSVTSVSLPVNPGVIQTTFKFYYESRMDTLTLSYVRVTRVISPACGAFNQIQNLAVVSSSFFSTKVLVPQLSTSSTTNVTIKL